MYAKRIELINYGPIIQVDLTFPFDNEKPKPIVFVGENGSGKSLLLSHLANGLLCAQQVVYPDSSEVEIGKVYKLRSSSYIRSGSQGYFAKVHFDNDLHIEELRLMNVKENYSTAPDEFNNPSAKVLWNNLSAKQNDNFQSNIDQSRFDQLNESFRRNCVLYFPSSRFEEPAWLNESNLSSRAQYMNVTKVQGQTARRIINNSPLDETKDWFFELTYDRAAFEMNAQSFGNLAARQKDNTYHPLPQGLPVFLGYHGPASNLFELAQTIIRKILRLDESGRIGIGPRANRTISIMKNEQILVPNLFQLSSGEVGLLGIFLSILRDADLAGLSPQQAQDIRGIVIIDEIDLHLHASHQYEVLPDLISTFPNVQFVITSHSPLFVLGLQQFFGKGGFEIYSLPDGTQISPENFGEFSNAYNAFKQTDTFQNEIRSAIEETQKPIVFVDGSTDIRYLTRASVLLGYHDLIDSIELRDGKGDANLKKTWNALITPSMLTMTQKTIVVVHDCDSEVPAKDAENTFRRRIRLIEENPITRGIENLFSRDTIEKAKSAKPAFIDIDPARTALHRGKSIEIPETWTVNKDEKTNLCHWICKHGTAEDFGNFREVFDLLREIPNLYQPSSEPLALPSENSKE